MTTLYYAPGACSLAAHIVLEWIGRPYRAVRVDPSDPAYLSVNPAGAVPALDHGGAAPLTQCAAILRFLARRHPEAGLDDDATPERGTELDRWASFLTGDLHPAFAAVFMPGRFTAGTDKAALDGVRDAALALVRKRLALLDRHMQGRAHVAGGERTWVDAYTVPMVRWASAVLPDGLAAYPDVRRHHEALLADPGVRRAMSEEGLA